MPGTGLGGGAAAGGGGGSVTSSHSPAGTRSDLAAVAPPTSTAPSAISSAARALDRPNILAIAASSRSPSSPSGTGTCRVCPLLIRGRRARRPGLLVRRGGGLACGLAPSMRRPRPDSRTARMPPQTMQESAMLNTGQCGSWIQSTT